MDKADLNRFIHVLEHLDGVDGQLANFKNRGAKAAVQAAMRCKKQGDDVPSWKPMTQALVKLCKEEPSATKAIKDIMKVGSVAADKKKGASLSLADAKKQARALLPKIQQVDDTVAQIIILDGKVKKEIGMGTLDASQNMELSVLVEKYCPVFVKYYAAFKIALNGLN